MKEEFVNVVYLFFFIIGLSLLAGFLILLFISVLIGAIYIVVLFILLSYIYKFYKRLKNKVNFNKLK